MLVLTGCSHTSDPNMGSLENQLKMKNKEIDELSASNKDKAKTIESYRMQLDKEASSRMEVIPAQYEWTEERVMTRQAARKSPSRQSMPR